MYMYCVCVGWGDGDPWYYIALFSGPQIQHTSGLGLLFKTSLDIGGKGLKWDTDNTCAAGRYGILPVCSPNFPGQGHPNMQS